MARTHNHRLIALGIALLVVAATVAVGTTGALAQENTDESNVLDDWLTEDETTNQTDENGWFDLTVDWDGWRTRSSAMSAALDGQFDRMQASISGVFDDTAPRSNNETVAQTKREINANSDEYVAEINDRTTPSETFDTHRVIVSHEGSKNAELYLVGNVTTVDNTTTLESMTALNASEYNATYPNRSVDETWGIDGDFAEDLPTVADAIANRIANNESLGRDYQGKLVGRFCGSTSFTDPGECDVRSTVWLDKSDLDVEEWTPPEDDEDDGFFPGFLALPVSVGVMVRAA